MPDVPSVPDQRLPGGTTLELDGIAEAHLGDAGVGPWPLAIEVIGQWHVEVVGRALWGRSARGSEVKGRGELAQVWRREGWR